MNVNLSKPRELVMEREASHAAVHGVAKTWTWLSDWTELMPKFTGEKLFHMDKITEHSIKFTVFKSWFSFSPTAYHPHMQYGYGNGRQHIEILGNFSNEFVYIL